MRSRGGVSGDRYLIPTTVAGQIYEL